MSFHRAGCFVTGICLIAVSGAHGQGSFEIQDLVGDPHVIQIADTTNNVPFSIVVKFTIPAGQFGRGGDFRVTNLSGPGITRLTSASFGSCGAGSGEAVTYYTLFSGAGPFPDPMTCENTFALTACDAGTGASSRRIQGGQCTSDFNGAPSGTSTFVTLGAEVLAGTPNGAYRLNIDPALAGYYLPGSCPLIAGCEGPAAVGEDYVIIVGPIVAPSLVSAVSRKNHAGFGDVDVDVFAGDSESRSEALSPPPGAATGDLEIIATFDQPVQLLGALNVTGGTVGATVAAGFTVTVPISSVAHDSKVTIDFANVAHSLDAGQTSSDTLCFPVAVGDTTNNIKVTSADVNQVKAHAGFVSSNADARSDVNADGIIDNTDVNLTKQHTLSTAVTCP